MAEHRFSPCSSSLSKWSRASWLRPSGSASASGLFLAAPRRTGKSTFVREDLRPALQRYGATVLYVDLWANKQADPGAVIVGAVRAELAKHEGHRRPAGQSRPAWRRSLSGGVAFSLDRVGLGKEISLSGAQWRRSPTRPSSRSCS
jgi:hypothetical protein